MHQIEAFVSREARQAIDYALWLAQDAAARERLSKCHGLIERITAVHPNPLPSHWTLP